MFCIKCGKTLEPTARVCPDCGTKVILPEGFVPENDIYFAFSGGEEINGKGALHIVEYFRIML